MEAIKTPYGVCVSGTATVRVMPDLAVLKFSTTQIEAQAREAFEAVRKASRKIQLVLSQAQISEAGTSHINLTEERTRQDTGEMKIVGYRTWVEFRVLLHDISRVEEILTSVIEAGVNHINAIDFQSTRLREVKDESLRQAISAARAKAEVYCAAAGVQLGEVIHIQDIEIPYYMLERGGSDEPPEDESSVKAFEPSSIAVKTSVQVAYKIQS